MVQTKFQYCWTGRLKGSNTRLLSVAGTLNSFITQAAKKPQSRYRSLLLLKLIIKYI